jgi:hypothetical protein
MGAVYCSKTWRWDIGLLRRQVTPFTDMPFILTFYSFQCLNISKEKAGAESPAVFPCLCNLTSKKVMGRELAGCFSGLTCWF